MNSHKRSLVRVKAVAACATAGAGGGTVKGRSPGVNRSCLRVAGLDIAPSVWGTTCLTGAGGGARPASAVADGVESTKRVC